MTITKLRPTFTFDQDRLDALTAIAPEAFADGKVNWEALREALGDRVEDEGRDAEHFGLFWPGKRDARRLASTPSAGTLKPAPGEGVNEATTRHLFIEGDNLEVLKLLQKSYAGRVKMIYIDPPYNTGNDFIYSDNFTQPVEEYLRATGQADEMGRVLVTNTQAGGRYHSNWLNMMYPRLRLARNLLSEDGVLIVSTDDSEVYNLRAILNEIFGEENFVVQLVWKSRQFPDARAVTHVSTDHEYALVFARTDLFGFRGIERDESKFDNPDNDPLGPWMSRSILGLATQEQRPNLHYSITDPDTGVTYQPPANTGWRYSRDRMASLIADRQILFPKNPNGRPREKKYRSDMTTEFISFPSIVDGVFTSHGTSEIRDLLGSDVFDFPKPSQFITRLLDQCVSGDDIVLDFFAGSCTTAHAVLASNREYERQNRFIMVQLPEPTSAESQAHRAGYPTIAAIGKERIRRVIQRMQAEDAGKLTTGREAPEDLGFRAFKLDRSHYKAWRDFEGGDVADLQTLFDRFESPLVEEWQAEDVLVEVMLMEGFPLDSTRETFEVSQTSKVLANTVTRVASNLVAHRLFVCLDAAVHDETIAALGRPSRFSETSKVSMDEEDIFICLDSALTDEAKVRLEDGRRVKVI